MKGFAKLGLLDWADPDSSEPAPSNLMTGITAMEMAHADPSLSVFFGVHTGLAMGSIITCGSDEQKRRWLPAMSRFEKIGAFALTEGSAHHHRTPDPLAAARRRTRPTRLTGQGRVTTKEQEDEC